MAGRRLLGVFAHPDDEVFCAGGTLARYTAQGAHATVVSATRGEAGQIRDAAAATRRTLAEVRERELRAACAELGVQRVRLLQYVDGTLADVEVEQLVGEVTELIEELAPEVIITFGADGGYGHPDHQAIGVATTQAVARLAAAGDAPRLFHSHFPRSRLLLLDRLAHWLREFDFRFQGQEDFVRAFSLFARESTTLGFAGDHIEVAWFPPGTAIVEQGEAPTSLYLILSGTVDIVQERVQERTHGVVEHLRTMRAGQFFGELALVQGGSRTATVIATDSVTCLVFSPGSPTPFGGRGPAAGLPAFAGTGGLDLSGATTVVDVSSHVDRKLAAIAAHRTQYPIDPAMFPTSIATEMLGREYFLRVHPPVEPEAELFD